MAKAPVLPTGSELPLEPRLARIGSVDQIAVGEQAEALEAKRKAARVVAINDLERNLPALAERERGELEATLAEAIDGFSTQRNGTSAK